MLYVQHQYEETYYEAGSEWQFELSALRGSSYLALPRPLAWAVGNANFHHVHHLSARIPNYRLRAAHWEQPIFRSTPVVTIRGSLGALRLKLWDQDRGRLVRFPSQLSPRLRAHSRARAMISSAPSITPSRISSRPPTTVESTTEPEAA
jgi:fatty acid desaturase